MIGFNRSEVLIMNFFQALNIKTGTIISLTGGGGKTTTMFAIAKEAKAKGFKTILTTTTKIYYPYEQNHEVILTEDSLDLLTDIQNKFKVANEIVVAIKMTKDHKLLGLNKNSLSLFFKAGADIVICEADGSAGKPFKGAAEHEPVIPPESNFIIHLIGVDCINKPIISENVHRPEIVANIAEVPIGTLLNDEIITKVLSQHNSYQKDLTKNCEWIPFINKVDFEFQLPIARKIALNIRKKIPCKVIIGSALKKDPIMDVIYR
jgi:probable selenium-dependent hydroxylase accessory protein YqeC